MIDPTSFWIVAVLLALATYAIRLSFLAWSQDRPFSPRIKRLLDFVPVTVLPALVAPLVVFPEATGGALDPPRLIAAGGALAMGLVTRSVTAVIVGGMVLLWTLQALIGA